MTPLEQKQGGGRVGKQRDGSRSLKLPDSAMNSSNLRISVSPDDSRMYIGHNSLNVYRLNDDQLTLVFGLNMKDVKSFIEVVALDDGFITIEEETGDAVRFDAKCRVISRREGKGKLRCNIRLTKTLTTLHALRMTAARTSSS